MNIFTILFILLIFLVISIIIYINLLSTYNNWKYLRNSNETSTTEEEYANNRNNIIFSKLFLSLEKDIKLRISDLYQHYENCENKSLKCGIKYEGTKKPTKKFEKHDYMLRFPIETHTVFEATNICRDNMSLIMAITCNPDAFLHRYIFREIYNTHSSFIQYYFFVTISVNDTINDLVEEENRKYGDIVQFDFVCHYYLLPYLLISSIRWINQKCKNYKYFVDHQSDTYFSLPFYLHNFENDQTIHPVIGSIYYGKPNRNPNSVSYMPVDAYPNDTYPKFPQGPMILLSEDTVQRICVASHEMKQVISFDDVYIGFLLKHANIDNFKNIMGKKRDEFTEDMSNDFIQNKLMYLHGLKPGSILYLSKNWE